MPAERVRTGRRRSFAGRRLDLVAVGALACALPGITCLSAWLAAGAFGFNWVLSAFGAFVMLVGLWISLNHVEKGVAFVSACPRAEALPVAVLVESGVVVGKVGSAFGPTTLQLPAMAMLVACASLSAYFNFVGWTRS